MASCCAPIDDSQTETAACVRFAVDMGRKISHRLDTLDFRPFESMPPETAVPKMVNGAVKVVRQAVVDTIRLLADLPPLLLDSRTLAAERWRERDRDDDDLTFDLDCPTDGVPEPALDRFAEDVDAALTSLTQSLSPCRDDDPQVRLSTWRMLIDELDHAGERLENARRQQSKWALITEGEDTRRKTVKALQYGLTLAVRSVPWPPDEPVLPGVDTLLRTSLAVRKTLIGYRRMVLARTSDVTVDDRGGIAIAMRALCVCITQITLDRMYSALRAYDRYQIQSLYQRVVTWLQDGGVDSVRGWQIIADVRAHAELLAGINQRAVLREHDQRLKSRCENDFCDLKAIALVSEREASLRYNDLLLDLERLEWRDERVGAFVHAELRAMAEPLADLMPRIEAAVAVLRTIQI